MPAGDSDLYEFFAHGVSDGLPVVPPTRARVSRAVHASGRDAGELIAEAVVAMEFRASSEDIGMICHAHPSLSEAMKDAALAVDKRALNI